jgi:tetratricopeptide (TPR) repeat protein
MKMKKVLGIFTIVLLLGLQSVYANSNSEKAQIAFEQANKFATQGNHKKAIEYFTKSYKLDPADGTAFNLGLDYEAIKDYKNALKWYKKAFEMGRIDGGVNAAALYEDNKDYPNAIKWYKKAINKGHINARKNLGLLYHAQHDNLNSAIYMMGMIGHPYTRKRVIGLLRNDWKIDKKTLLKAYQLQKKLIPDPYLDPEFESLIPKPKEGNRDRRSRRR